MEAINPAAPQLTESEVSEIEARAKKYRDLAKRAATPADEDVIKWLTKTVSALIRDWRALRQENERLNRLIAEATVTAPWRAGYTDYVPTAGDPVRSVADLIAHIKERGGRVSELESSVTFWQAEALLNHFCSEHAKNTRQVGHYCTICARPFVMSVPQGERPPKYNDLITENAALREQLAEAQRCHADAEEDLASARLRISELHERLEGSR